MEEDLTYKGEWYLPSNSDDRLHGTLTITPKKGPILALYGSFEKSLLFSEYKNQKIILGITNNSDPVTLYKCQMSYSGDCKIVVGEESGKPTTKYYIQYALVGIHELNVEDIKFNVISSQFINLDEWVGISGFKINRESISNNGEININYKKPESVSFDIDEKAKGQLKFIVNYPQLSRFQKYLSITQNVEYRVNFQEDRAIQEILKYIHKFQRFLTLALYKHTYPSSLTLKGTKYFKDYKYGGRYYINIKLFLSSTQYNSNDLTIDDYDMLFNYDSIKNEFPDIIKSWYSKYEMFKAAFGLVIEQFYRGNQFSINTFLNLAQSAETFHAQVNNHTRIPSAQYKKMKVDILNVVPTEYHQWLKDQFNFGNELNLHTRLTEIVDKYSNPALDEIIGDKKQFILDVKRSRNYYTHYNKSLLSKAIKGGDLYYLSERLKVLLVCSFLIEIGLDKEKVASFISNTKYVLFNHLIKE